MLFASFVGVNHHGQSVLLGCGLLSTENTDSFIWLFESWLCCMSSRPLVDIVTDQCKAMQNAIQIVFPQLRHRWCLWHIIKKILKSWNYILNIEILNMQWNKLFMSYHQGLSGLFKERQRWVPCFLKTHFWARMLATQQSESINAFFDEYINSMITLQQFLKQYDNALQDKVKKGIWNWFCITKHHYSL